MKDKLKLIGFDDIFVKLVNLYHTGKLPSKILINGQKGIGKSLFVTHFINYILSQNEENKYNIDKFSISHNNRSFKLFKDNIHPNIFKIDKKKERKFIEISQIREMIKFQNNSSFNNNGRFIIINDVSSLNLNSTNALLKSLEEPNENVFFILIHNTGSMILDTLKSRCIEFRALLSQSSVKLIVDDYYSEKIYNLLSNDLISYYNNPSFIIALINYLKENSLDYSNLKIENLIYFVIKNKHYVKDQFIIENINILIELFFYKNIKLANNVTFKVKNYFYFKFNQIQKYNLDLESFFLEFEEKLLSE